MISFIALVLSVAIVVNSNKYVKTPHGVRLQKCVNHAPSGSIITPYSDHTEIFHPKSNTRKQYPLDPDCINDMNQLFPPSNTGFQNLQTWVDYAYYPLPSGVSMGNFTSTYNVPSAVTSSHSSP